jgi:hypothetical protein
MAIMENGMDARGRGKMGKREMLIKGYKISVRCDE